MRLRLHRALLSAAIGLSASACVDARDGDANDAGANDRGDSSSDQAPSAFACPGLEAAAIDHAALPDGHCAWVFASRLSDPRGVDVAANGDILVVERGAGRVTALFDDDGDGISGPAEYAWIARAPGLNHGIRIQDGYLYASSQSTVYRWPYATGARVDLGPPETVVSGMPQGGNHVTRTLTFDFEGRLYVHVGSEMNVDPDSSRARINRFDVTTIPAGGIPFASGEVFADGLRNEVAVNTDSTGRLWGIENGVDELVREDLGGDIHEDNPGEEIGLFAEAGAFYGYPYCWSEFILPEGVGMGAGTQWAHPDFLADGVHTDGWCRDPANAVAPRGVLQAHSAPLDLVFYDGSVFGAGSAGDMFVALHGSWNRTAPTGYMVVRVPFEAGSDTPGDAEPFLYFDGQGDFAVDWPHRPVGVRVAADGSLVVTSDASGVVIRIARRQ